MKIIKPANIDPSKITISKISSFSMGPNECKKIEIRYDGQPFYLMGPKMFSPFGLCQYPKPEDVRANTKVKYHLQMNFKGEKDGFEKFPTIETLYNACVDIDFHMVELLLKESGNFLNEETTERSIIDNMYNRVIQKANKEEYDSYFKMKMPTEYNSPGKFKPTSFSKSDKNKPLDPNVERIREFMSTRKWVKPVFLFDCLFYINGKIYPSIEAYQLKIYDEEEKENTEKTKTTKVVKKKKSKLI